MAIETVKCEIAGRTLSIETGRLAKQAHGSVVVQYADTVVLATAVSANPRPGIDFFPLTVDYRENAYSAGRIPGNWFRREGRPSQKETLTMRMIDRPIRPLFPDGYKDEVQIITAVHSADQENDPDILAVIGASAALGLSPIPFQGPIGAVRVGYVDGKLVVNPTHSQLEFSSLELVLAGTKDDVNMIELAAREVGEDLVAEAIQIGHEQVVRICEIQEDLLRRCGKQKVFQVALPDDALVNLVREKAEPPLAEHLKTTAKQERNNALREVREAVADELSPPDDLEPEYDRSLVFNALYQVEKRLVRDMIRSGKRPDGRGRDEIRPITCEVGALPRTHGSAIFTRGETQALVVITLGTPSDELIIDGLNEEYSKKFILHYNFPPYSVGEVKRIGAPSRRDVGHGALAEKSLESVLPGAERFPYTIRMVSDILESNGSSSMATVCGGTLALMDAGVPIKDPVAGISIGLVSDPDNPGNDILLTDIIGDEDHFGDMDFKVAGTQHGITGIQLDLKIRGLRHDLIVQALRRAHDARIQILRKMLTAIDKPRAEISRHAPRMLILKIDPEKIGRVIGPAGKEIKRIQESTGARIDIENDGTVYISCVNARGAELAREEVEKITEEIKVGKIYSGRVASIKDFGAFIEIAPGQDGLCHVSELSDQYVDRVSDVCKIGDEIRVKVIAIDDQGRVKLSRKQAMTEETQVPA